jgi:hypothetical protein
VYRGTIEDQQTDAPGRAERFAVGCCVGHDRAMPTWKPHSLARPRPDQLDLRRGDKVSAKIDLQGVPEGTPGKVILANGFNWMRYRVRFKNGAELPDLDDRHLVPTGRAARRLAKRGRVATA